MMFGAEGFIGIINTLLLLGMSALIVLLMSTVRYQRSKQFQLKIQRHAIRYGLIGLILMLLALPSVTFLLWAGWDYIEQKPRRDAFERNNQRLSALLQTLQADDLAAFKQALAHCGTYCIHVEPGHKTYDELVITAQQANAAKIEAYLNTLNQAEVAQPYPQGNVSKPTPWVELEN
jgi:hypothetical protein